MPAPVLNGNRCAPRFHTAGTHVECQEQATGKKVEESFVNSGADFFCSQECRDCYAKVEMAVAQRLPVR